MHLKCLACEALARPVYLAAARTPHIVDVELLQLGWHQDPDDLRARLQAKIAAAASGSETAYDAIVLAYGLCGRSTEGLRAEKIPIVLPRAHDCITLFLGSRARYQCEFADHPGTYWYARDYVERNRGGSVLSLGAETFEISRALYESYVEKYGEENAEYLMEVMGAWQAHYDRAVYVAADGFHSPAIEAQAQAEAERRGWRFERVSGDLVLIRRLLWGEWDDDFLVVEPGQRIKMTYDADVVTSLSV